METFGRVLLICLKGVIGSELIGKGGKVHSRFQLL